MKTLFINACVRQESRTLLLAEKILGEREGTVERVDLEKEDLRPLGREMLEERDAILREGRLEDPMLRYARQFAEADEIVIAAPYWDLGFPALLKIYLEQITVVGVTFHYVDGRPAGLCRAKRLTYVTTSGGLIRDDFGYAYVKALAKNFYGISQTEAHRAMNLDIEGISAGRFFGDAKIETLN